MNTESTGLFEIYASKLVNEKNTHLLKIYFSVRHSDT